MKNQVQILSFLFFLGLLLHACAMSFDKEKATAEILKLHDEQRRVHFEKQPAAFAEMLSENHISVNRGKIRKPTFEENKNRFSNYFNSVDFVKWDDVKPPIIRFSNDGSMAYTIVEKEVIVKYPADDKMVFDTTEYAWIAIYKKHADGWKIDCVASTNVPNEE